MRAGARALTLLSAPLHVHVLRALEEPKSLEDLRRAVGSPPQTTMREHLRLLADAGIIERNRRPGFPGPVGYELRGPGRDLLDVARILRAWLAVAPNGPVDLGGTAAKGAVKALADGWSSTMVRALAGGPLSLTELSRLIPALNYPSLERRLGAMREAGQLEPCRGDGRSNPYAVTEWLRRAAAPLAAAARWESRNLPSQSAPVTRMDVEAVLLLAVPLVRVPGGPSGTCRLAVEVQGGDDGNRDAGVTAALRDGRAVSCVARLERDAAGSVSGTASSWLRATLDADLSGLEMEGDPLLGRAIVGGLRRTLSVAQPRV